ncbi:TPA: CoA transferase [Acinetobacter nosocomialis]|uniref:CaiB/BaiF CoA transferase family protein n=1 Tax=Acinetobacter calcoaceticus/baumannii complex TaxID=909768 RepID=UPI0002AED598|nr:MULTISPECIES: CaiB/BaiF CoA-transferase family protein [Acinetobacter calcoaceticus/baumannii complex]ELW80895.1 CoA-transferase family III protein [Acinetobacter sp. OIFC021]EXE51630.1 coA-transferase III family protein [Acinetobacter sp. 766875]MDE1665717.1 CaiB/BaiF CoA-transferase family protein [Acinetobacter nosocomialis]HAI55436.1 CoA transferase [Acinetobacter nosocomialis]HDH7779290.1 CoA transferase [Acinetobacter nosocomialis]
MTTALNGLKVLDFSTLLPGPFATMYLADMGAEVIHIESPSRPDLIRIMPPYANGQATAHSYLNRNKQSIVLDLKDAASIDLIKAKISEFDIVIEQFRPDVMRRLGLDYATLAEINPRLIYCSITGYGQTGSYKDRAGHDINYLALAGISGYSGRQDSGPPPLGIQVADIAGGSLHAVIAILAAVVERSRSGIGQYIDISMTDCVASLNSMAASATLAGQVEQAPEKGMLNGGIFYDYYMTQDGRYLSIGSLEPQFMAGLSAALDLPVLLQKGASLDAEDRQEVKQAIQEKIKTKTFKEWHEIFANLDVCVEPVLSLSEALNSPLAQQRGWIVNVPLQNNTADTEPQIACPIKFSRSQMRYSFVGQKVGEGQW